MKKTNFKILSLLVSVGIALTLLVLMALPMGLTALLKISNLQLPVKPSVMAFQLTLCVYACAVPYVIALFKLKSICMLLIGENPFDLKVSKDFGVISLCAFSESIIFLSMTLLTVFAFNLYLYAFTIISVIVVTFISVTAGFLFKVIASVFERASEIKEDNDMTF